MFPAQAGWQPPAKKTGVILALAVIVATDASSVVRPRADSGQWVSGTERW